MDPDAHEHGDAFTSLADTLLPQETAKALANSGQWPGWFSDSQIASEYAQQLSRQLRACVNSGELARRWLESGGIVTRTRRGVPDKDDRKKRRKKKRKRRRKPPPQTKRPAPRQFLNAQGATAAIWGVIYALLPALWMAAAAAAYSAVLALLGLALIPGYQQALADLIAEGQSRVHGITQTRLSRLERVLLQALREGWSADRLAAEIDAILGNMAAALLVTVTETSWASGWLTRWAYRLAGVKYVRWVSRRDGRTCKFCLGNDMQGPIPLGQTWQSGAKWIPQHPRCRCAIIPVKAPKRKRKGSP